MDKHLRSGSNRNDKDQTLKLQQFLNKHGFGSLPLTGFFGPLTEAAVKKFQKTFGDDVLNPWGIGDYALL
jgi:peptidoglycan hydrolase-like protein with peptidoglycan-binding domain